MLTVDIDKANIIIEDCFSKMRTARMYLQLIDEILPLTEQKNSKLYIETITPLCINTLCCTCIYNLVVIYKHMMLSKDADLLFFITHLCGEIYENFKTLNEYNDYISSNFPKDIYKEYKLKKRKIGIYQKKLDKIRNKTSFHIEKEFRVYYDTMLESFKIPILDIYNDMMDFINYLQSHNKVIMNSKIETHKSLIYENALSYIKILEDEIIAFPENKEKHFWLNELKKIFTKK